MNGVDQAGALALLRRAVGAEDASFRPGQWEAINAIVNERLRLLVVERTGWGKSSVYFIATRILRDRGRGPTLIVSPLLALMRNQVEAAHRLGIRALTINSTNRDRWPEYHHALESDEVDAILISPERLANDEFVSEVLLPIAGSVGMLVVDEAHCISDWGHDFRPDYRRVVQVLRRMPANLPVLGTTATANDRVIGDIVTQLGQIDVRRGPLMRETLALGAIELPDQAARLAWLAEHVPALPGTGIIYVLTKRNALQVSDWLRTNAVDAHPYFSGVLGGGFDDSNEYRRHLEQQLLDSEIKVLVATSALGMGYDKPDLAFVIHYQAPGSIVAYYQQVGRAGRGIEKAHGILLAGREDDDIHEYFRRTAFPSEANVRLVLDALEAGDGLSIQGLERAANLRRGQIEHVLRFLSVESPSPVIKQGSRWTRTPITFAMDHERIARLARQREAEWQEVREYIRTEECLMRFLASALDDESAAPCGRCSVCRGVSVIPTSYGDESLNRANRFVRAAEFDLVCKRQVAAGEFSEYGFRGNLPLDHRANTGRVLSRWNDAGWGRMVADDKHAGHFRDELVEAATEMLLERWKPNPMPAWVTCIPSLEQTDLVQSLAQRLAVRLRLPFHALVTKVRDNEPQKTRENRFHRCANLDGAFAVAAGVPEAPVLLVDDVVDSAWTMTVVAALLRRAGSGVVWPLALAAAGAGD